MRWPDIFFRAGKRREENTPPFKRSGDGGPRLNAPAMPTVAIKPTAAISVPVADTGSTQNVARETDKNSPPAEEAVAQKRAASVGKTDTPKRPEADTASSVIKDEPVGPTKSPPLEARSPQTGPIPIPTKVPDPSAVSPIPSADPRAPGASSVEPVTSSKETTSPTAPSASAPQDSGSKPTAPSRTEAAPTAPAARTIRAKRKMKLTDLARMIFSSPHEPTPVAPESTSAVSPPAFTVPVPIGTVTQAHPPTKGPDTPTIDLPREEKPVAEEKTKPVEPGPVEEPAPKQPVTEAKASAEASTPRPEPEKKAEASTEAKTADVAPPKPESTPTSTPPESALSKSTEKKEFLLVNGERILGHVLSETPENLYLDHGTLGVLTLPRSQIATRPIEIILINGDRIVGDIMAETPDTLYVRHASLGMLTVPRSQRSTRVVEALLKDGDRILGEVLAETENFTVIRSATLGTVAVPHGKVAMLNRKIEQIELKSLPTAAPAIEDKSSA